MDKSEKHGIEYKNPQKIEHRVYHCIYMNVQKQQTKLRY